MADPTPLTLTTSSASFTLTDFEVPPRLESLGGEQLHAVHQLFGGRRTIQTFGDVPHHAITWGGVFLGANANDRAQALDAIRRSGTACTLSYDRWKYQGLLARLDVTPGFAQYKPYRATFVPAIDQTQTAPQTSVPTTEATVAQQGSILNALAAAYSGVNLTIGRTIAGVTSALSVLSTMQAQAGGLIASIPPTSLALATATFTGAASAIYGVVEESCTPVGGLGVPLAVAALDAQQADILFSYQYYAQLQVLIYALGQPAVVLNTQTFNNPNLLLIAAAVYGDPGQWGLISSANNGFPIQAYGTYTLVLPPA